MQVKTPFGGVSGRKARPTFDLEKQVIHQEILNTKLISKWKTAN